MMAQRIARSKSCRTNSSCGPSASCTFRRYPARRFAGSTAATPTRVFSSIDKEAGGSKADAVNAGLNAATSPYVCVVDSDSVLERDALLRIMIPVLADPEHVVGVGGIIRILNGSEIQGGHLARVRLPRKSIEVIQVIEYLRAFLIGREAWAQGNMMMIISGAFGLFRTDLVRAVGGYRAKAIGEDFDLVTRLHRHLLEKKVEYRIKFVPDPVCWTEAPSDLKSLGRQRARWQKGLLDTLLPNRDMLFRPRYGRVGWLALPYLWIFELFAPVIEIGGILTIILAAALGILSREFFIQFMIFGYAFATVISMGAVLQEEITYKTVQRLAGHRPLGQLLLSRTFSLSSAPHVLAAPGPLAVHARRYGLETSGAQRPAIHCCEPAGSAPVSSGAATTCQLIEKVGSPGWIRISNPPVNLRGRNWR